MDKHTILVVDDSPANVGVLMGMLHADYAVRTAVDGSSALSLALREPLPDLVLLDVEMPGMDGFEVCRRLKADPRTRELPVIFVTARSETRDEALGLELGAVDYVSKPFTASLVRARVRNHLELKAHRDHLEHLVARRTAEILRVKSAVFTAIGAATEFRDPETGAHIKRTQHYVRALARRLAGHPRFAGELSEPAIEQLFLSAPLHDLGKVGIPDRILLKPGRLSAEEFDVIKTHTRIGGRILRSAERDLEGDAFLAVARDIAEFHHERWDGSGYPEGRGGEEIPLAARLMAVADVYDALISRRVYKAPVPHAQAVDMMLAERGRQFDPDVTDAFAEVAGEFAHIARRFQDATG